MNPKKIADHFRTAREAADRLCCAGPYLSTREAVQACPLQITAETLLDTSRFPDFVLPRVQLDPRAKRPTYYFNPVDIEALPSVLRLWSDAIATGSEEEFKASRRALLRERDLHAAGMEAAA